MSKNRPYIPPPKFTPPNAADQGNLQAATVTVSASAQQAAVANVPRETPAPPLAAVPPPARVASIKILPDRVEFTNPTIDLSEYVWLKHEPVAKQTNKLTPDRAVVAHGLLIIEEYRLAIPLDGARIRT